MHKKKDFKEKTMGWYKIWQKVAGKKPNPILKHCPPPLPFFANISFWIKCTFPPERSTATRFGGEGERMGNFAGRPGRFKWCLASLDAVLFAAIAAKLCWRGQRERCGVDRGAWARGMWAKKKPGTMAGLVVWHFSCAVAGSTLHFVGKRLAALYPGI